MVDLKLMAAGVLALVACSRCSGSHLCYPASSAEIELLIVAGECKDLIMHDVRETTMRFTNDDPTVSVYIDIDYNPAVRRVEADGRGDVTTSRIDEVVRTNTNCRGNASGARLLDITIGNRGDGEPNFCNLDPEPGSIVRLAAEEGVVVAGIGAFADDWSSVTLEVDESAWPTSQLTTSVAPVDMLQKFGSRMDDVRIFVSDDDVLSAYFLWLDSEGYDGTVHVNSDDGQQTPVQVYPPVGE